MISKIFPNSILKILTYKQYTRTPQCYGIALHCYKAMSLTG